MMEMYKLLAEGVGMVLTPALLMGGIYFIYMVLKQYHVKQTKRVVMDYLKELQKDD